MLRGHSITTYFEESKINYRSVKIKKIIGRENTIGRAVVWRKNLNGKQLVERRSASKDIGKRLLISMIL